MVLRSIVPKGNLADPDPCRHGMDRSDEIAKANESFQNQKRREPGGWYQNGGSWLLWEFLAEYSALRHGDFAALQGIQQSIAAEVAVTPLSKEFKVTINNPAIGSVDPASIARASVGTQR
jgi:hypothetical protein